MHAGDSPASIVKRWRGSGSLVSGHLPAVVIARSQVWRNLNDHFKAGNFLLLMFPWARIFASIAWATQLLKPDNIGLCAQGWAEEQLSNWCRHPHKIICQKSPYSVKWLVKDLLIEQFLQQILIIAVTKNICAAAQYYAKLCGPSGYSYSKQLNFIGITGKLWLWLKDYLQQHFQCVRIGPGSLCQLFARCYQECHRVVYWDPCFLLS